MNSLIFTIGLVVLAGMAGLAIPVGTILAINALFLLEIPVSIATWFAAAWVTYLLIGR